MLGPELVSLRSLRASGDAAPVYSTAMVAFQHKLGAIRASIRDLGRGLDPVIAIKTLQQQLTPVEVQENAAWQRLGIPACVNR